MRFPTTTTGLNGRWETGVSGRTGRERSGSATVELADGSLCTVCYQKAARKEKCPLLWSKWRLPAAQGPRRAKL